MESLIERVVEGDRAAWQAFWAAVEPTIWAVTGKWQITGPLSKNDDERRNMVVEVMQLLRNAGFRRLRSYLESTHERASSSFKTWLATVTARAAIDYVRAHPELEGARSKAGEPRWVRFVPLSGMEIRPTPVDATRGAIVGQLLERAKRDLRNEQLRALSYWLEGWTFQEIRVELGLREESDADRLVRSALKRMRDRFHETSRTRIDPPESFDEARRREETQ